MNEPCNESSSEKIGECEVPYRNDSETRKRKGERKRESNWNQTESAQKELVCDGGQQRKDAKGGSKECGSKYSRMIRNDVLGVEC